MIALTLAEVAAVTGGALHGTTPEQAARLRITGPVVTDSREAAPGSLYVARVGERMDGHDFIGDAGSGGAVAALTSRATGPLPAVVVADVQGGFAALARHVVDVLPDLTVIGITGSSGKTSTKDLLASVLSAAGETVAPVGSLNSEVGVPLTVCRATERTRFLVVEMGARGIGHIRYLTEIAPPDVGVVLNVGVAHLGEFGSREAIGEAKSELVQALPPEGVAVLNVDDDVVARMAGRSAARVVRVGRGPAADVRAVDVRVDDAARARFTLVAGTERHPVSLRLHGEHHVANALSVAAAALECGMVLPDVAAGLEAARPTSRWRMEVVERADGVTVVNDAYNANPDSMRAAIDALSSMAGGRRSWAVLGSMLELGDDSDEEHRGVGRVVAKAGIDRVLVVGALARPLAEGATSLGGPDGPVVDWVPDADAALTVLSEHVRPGDVVLFKSSRDAGLRLLGDRVSGRMEDPS